MGGLSSFGRQLDEGDEHLFHRDAAVLEGIAVITDVVIVVIGVSEETVAGSKNVAGAEVGRRQVCTVGIRDIEDFARIIVEVLAELIAQVGVGVLVSLHANGCLATDAAVVGSEQNAVVALREGSEKVGNSGVAEPTEGDAAVGGLVAGQFAHHAALGTGVGEHVDEVQHADVEVVLVELRQLLNEFLGG